MPKRERPGLRIHGVFKQDRQCRRRLGLPPRHAKPSRSLRTLTSRVARATARHAWRSAPPSPRTARWFGGHIPRSRPAEVRPDEHPLRGAVDGGRPGELLRLSPQFAVRVLPAPAGRRRAGRMRLHRNRRSSLAVPCSEPRSGFGSGWYCCSHLRGWQTAWRQGTIGSGTRPTRRRVLVDRSATRGDDLGLSRPALGSSLRADESHAVNDLNGDPS